MPDVLVLCYHAVSERFPAALSVTPEAFERQLHLLARAGYRVYVPERRGHAHTPDRPGPLTYELMAEDTVAYLESIVGGRAHLVGWSDGAVVALLAAMRRPDLVDRLILIGQYYNSSGRVTGGIVDQLQAAGDQAMNFCGRSTTRHRRTVRNTSP